MIQSFKYAIAIITLSMAFGTYAEKREVLETSNDIDAEEKAEFNKMMIEQAFLETLFIKNAGVIVTPYYDEFGRWGVKVISDNTKPYYVDPYYDDPMTTNRHSDEPNTSTNWRVVTW
jgi:hypothetical protein